MKTFKLNIIALATLIFGAVVSTACNEEIDQLQETSVTRKQTSLNKEKLNNLDERGKIMYNIIIAMKIEQNHSIVQELKELLESNFTSPSYNQELKESEINLYGEILNNFSTKNFNDFIDLNNNLRIRIDSIASNSSIREILLNDLSSFEWIKAAIEETIDTNQPIIIGGFNYQAFGNPVPGPYESSGNYIDRCMENYINENFTWANWVDRAKTVIAGPAGLLWAFASCEFTYYFDNPHKK